MKNIAWIIGFGLMVSLLGCDTEDYGQYQTFIKGDWEGTERVDGLCDSLSLLKYHFEESGKALLIICKLNSAKVSGLDTISINTGSYVLNGNKLHAKTNYVVSANIRESMLQANILFLNQDSMALETTDGLKRTRVGMFKRIN